MREWKKQEIWPMLLALLAGCAAMAVVDAVIRPGYLLKSLVKLGLFASLPLLACRGAAKRELMDLFRWKGLGCRPLILGLGVYGLILGLYFTIGPFFDFTGVVGALQSELGVNAGNFLLVSLYISFVNSLLEEFFFRGFGFLLLRRRIPQGAAYAFSAGAFALYHVAMMIGWFKLDLLALLIALLVAAGLFLDFFDRRSENLYFSWFIHMFANFSINTVGFLLLAQG